MEYGKHDEHSTEKKEASARRNKVISEYLDRITDDFLVMFEEIHGTKLLGSDKEFFRIKSKGILFYWLGVVYDESISEVKNLESALDTSQTMVKKLRDSQQELQAIIQKTNSSQPTEAHSQLLYPTSGDSRIQAENRNEKKTDPPPSKQNLADKIDGFYSHVNKGPNKSPKK